MSLCPSYHRLLLLGTFAKQDHKGQNEIITKRSQLWRRKEVSVLSI